jgi:hypothetical protein
MTFAAIGTSGGPADNDATQTDLTSLQIQIGALDIAKAPVSTTVTLTGTQTLTNKSISASQLTGDVAVARIATALTAPGPIGGTTAGTVAMTDGSVTGILSFDLYASEIKPSSGVGTKFDFAYNGLQYGNIDGLGISWANALNPSSSKHVGVFAYADNLGVVEINSTTKGVFRDLKLRCLKYDRTDTAAGATGAQTINKGAGSVNFAAGATSLVVTNSLVTAGMPVLLTVQTNDATAKSALAVSSSGSFTIYLNAAATAETRVAFQLQA